MAYRCRNYKLCHNTYTDTAGDWGKKAGADCLPCYYAGLFRGQGQTPEDIEAVPMFLQEFMSHLQATGWRWADVKRSYEAEVTTL